MKIIDTCRCCGEQCLEPYLDLGNQPLANSYHKGEEQPYFPLLVNYCTSCWHSQLSCVIDPDLMFKNYLYVSGTTETFRNHCYKLAEDAVARSIGLSVLDVAANDGTLLNYFRSLGCQVHGVDPAENLRELTASQGIEVTVDYWREDIDLGKKFDIITGTNVFAHVHDSIGFLKACHRHLNDNGLLILEFPYCRKMLENGEFDTIYHEHLSYFLVTPFVRLINRLGGFYIEDVLLTPIHGGSIRFYLRIGNREHGKKVSDMIVAEQQMLCQETFLAFAKRVESQKVDLKKLLSSLPKVIGYGASAKGNTMLNTFAIDLAYIVDDNPLKWGYFTPGRNIPIANPVVLAAEEELCILLLAWNFAEEIKKRVARIRRGKPTTYITYVPNVCYENFSN